MAGAGAAAPLGSGAGLAGRVWPQGWSQAPSWPCRGLSPAEHGSAACFSFSSGEVTLLQVSQAPAQGTEGCLRGRCCGVTGTMSRDKFLRKMTAKCLQHTGTALFNGTQHGLLADRAARGRACNFRTLHTLLVWWGRSLNQQHFA